MTVQLRPFEENFIPEAGWLLAQRHRADRTRFPLAYRLAKRVDPQIAWTRGG